MWCIFLVPAAACEKIETQRHIIYAIVLLAFYPPLLSLQTMGSSSSKSSSSSSSSSTADIESVFADMFADAMERADWHGKRKPTWQQAHDHFVVQMRVDAAAVA